MRAQTPHCRMPSRPASPKNSFGWIAPLSRKRRVGMDAGGKRRAQHRVLVHLLAREAWKRVAALGCRSSRVRAQRPPRLVYLTQIDRLPPRQDADRSTAEIGLNQRDITRIAISHTHGDHIGNVAMFADATILMQQAEYSWINSPNGPNDNVNQLMALARQLLGTPKNLQLIDGAADVFGDGSVTLVPTPGHTPGRPIREAPEPRTRRDGAR
jgi:glyoxylase-like metal-dependent hydrolase (beta-lactamase superfamily II)